MTWSGTSGRSRSRGAPRGSSHGEPHSRLLWRAIAWRLSSSIAFFLVATVAVASAAAGPLYLSAADQSIVTTSLTNVPPRLSGITLNGAAGTQPTVSQLLRAVSSIPGGAGAKPSELFKTPILTTDFPGLFYSPVAGGPDSVDLVSRNKACSYLHLVAGRCPTGAEDVLISTRTATQLRAHLGSVLPLFKPGEPPKGPPEPVRGFHMKVSGIYTPGSAGAPEWWGNNFFPYGDQGVRGSTEALDAGFVSPSGAARLAGVLPPTSWAEIPLRPRLVTAPGVSNLLSSLSVWEGRIQPRYSINAGSNLPSLLSADQTEESSAGSVILLVTIQLLLLALLVLFAVARESGSLRTGDVRVAELRGLPPSRIAMLVMREPFFLLLAALPAGIALGWLSVSGLSLAVLGVGAPTPDLLVFVAALVAFAAGVGASALASLALLRTGYGQEAQEASIRRRGRNAAVVDALGVALAVGAIADLVANHGTGRTVASDPLAVAGPGLLALGIGILGARLLPLFARGVESATRWSHRVALELAARTVNRKDVMARRVVTPAIAAGLLVFSVTGLVVSQRNYAMQARFTVGAPAVLSVEVRPGVDFLDATRAADKGSAPAMAVVDVRASYGETLAVDASRLPSVVQWPAGLSSVSLERLSRELSPKMPPERRVPSGNKLVLTADLRTPVSPLPDLQLALFDGRYFVESHVDFGNLRPGTHTYAASLAGVCPSGCRLDGFTVYWAAGPKADPRASDVTLRLESLSVGSRQLPMGFTHPGAWQGGGAASVSEGQGGVTASMNLLSGGSPTIMPVSAPSLVPAVLTAAYMANSTNAQQPGEYAAAGLDENEITTSEVASVGELPAIGSSGALVDLGILERLQTGAPAGTTFQVWTTGPPSQAFLSRLARSGIQVTGTRLSDSVFTSLKRSGPSLGFDLFSVTAIAGIVLATAALLFALTASARRRAIEVAGLMASGVTRRDLRRSFAIEALMVSLMGAVLGLIAGVIGAILALPQLPEFVPGRIGPPLQMAIPWLTVLLSAAAVLALLVGAAVVSAQVIVRRVRPDQLRLQP